jgi:folate-dependent phosphoribosylglycinamide formyltransferase PurN
MNITKNIVLLIGNHTRHIYFADKIHSKFPLSGIIIEKRENIIPKIKNIYEKKDIKNFNKHFANRDYFEKKYFNNTKLPNVDRIEIISPKKNSKKIINFIKKMKPSLVILFGASVLSKKILDSMPLQTINLHAGLAPYYRGSACNFWPFYFLSPHHAGYTYHKVEKEVDKGNIILHSLPKLKKGLSIHEVNCLGLISAITDFSKIVKFAKMNNKIPSKKINNQGKFFFSSDFKPQHLRNIYNLFSDNIVDYYIENKNQFKKLKLINL